MKKILFSLILITWIAAGSSCSSSSSFESDVKKMAKYQCEMKQLMAADPSDEKAQKKMAELQKEVQEFATKMEEKHKDKKDDKEWEAKGDKIMAEEMAKCK